MRIIFMGTAPFACQTLGGLLADGRKPVCVVTQPDRPRGRGRKYKPGPVKQLALEHGLDVFQPASVNTPESLEHFRSLAPELIVVAAFGQRLGRRLLKLAPLGAFNLHASLLPAYRGAAPINRVILDGADHSGVTLMRMAPRIDTGGILLQERLAIGPEETAPELELRLGQLAARMVVGALPQLADGSLTEQPQDSARATLAPRLAKADGEINWRRTAWGIACQVRGTQPWPMSFTHWYHRGRRRGERLILWRARPVVVWPDTHGQPPGGVIAVTDGQIIVQTGAGALSVTELQAAGRRRMPVEAFIRGNAVISGDMLGPGPSEGKA